MRPEARACRLGGLAIHEITALSVTNAIEFFRELTFADDQRPVAEPIVAEIVRRLAFLDRVGTEYLTLDRPADTLSGGERQRVRLATGIGSGLVGVLYLLDEPSIGLHPRDNDRLIAALRDLQQQGNTVVVVEHDEALMRSQRLFDRHGAGRGALGRAGRGAGNAGRGRPNSKSSLTGAYLSGRQAIPVPTERRQPAKIAHAAAQRRDGQQSAGRRRRDSAGAVRVRHRRQRLGQEFAGGRYAGPGAGPQAERRRGPAGAAPRLARREPARSAGRGRSIADRPHAAEQPGHVHRRVGRHSPRVRRHEAGPAARLRRGPVQLQHQGRPVRGVRRAGRAARSR